MKNTLSACLLILTLLSALLTTACNRSNSGTAGSTSSPSAGARRGGNAGGNAGGGAAGGGGERRTGNGGEAKLEGLLDRLRQDPDSRSQILARMKSKLEQRNDDRIDERVAGLNKLFDKVLALSDKEYQDQRAHLARNMRRVLHGGTAIRGGSSGRPGGGGGNGSGGPGGRRGQGARGPAGEEDDGAPVSAASGAPGAASGAPRSAPSGAPASGEPNDEDL